MAGKGKIAGGIVLLVLGIIFSGISYSISNQCSSAAGQFQGFFDSQNRGFCMIANFVLIVGIFLAIIGLVLLIIGAVSKDKKDKGKFFCRYCGQSINQAAEFCPSCGKSIRSKSKGKECVYCKARISDESKFCANCGKPFPDHEPENTSKRESESTSVSIDKATNEKTHAVSKGKSSDKKTIWIIVIITVTGSIGVGLGLYFMPSGSNVFGGEKLCEHIMTRESIRFNYPCDWDLDTYPDSTLPYKLLVFLSASKGGAFGELKILDATQFAKNIYELGNKNYALAQQEPGFRLIEFTNMASATSKENILVYEYSSTDPDTGSHILNRVMEKSFDLYGKLVVTRFEAMAYIINGESAFSQIAPDVNSVIRSIQ